MFRSLYQHYEAVCKGYITQVRREYEFDLQSTEFEFKFLQPDLGEIPTDVMRFLAIGKSIVAKMSYDLDLQEVVTEAAAGLLDHELGRRVTLREIDTKKQSFDRLLDWFTHVVLRFISYLTSFTNSSDKDCASGFKFGSRPSTVTYIWQERI